MLKRMRLAAAWAGSLALAAWMGYARGSAAPQKLAVTATPEYRSCVDTVRRVGEINARYHRELDALRK